MEMLSDKKSASVFNYMRWSRSFCNIVKFLGLTSWLQIKNINKFQIGNGVLAINYNN